MTNSKPVPAQEVRVIELTGQKLDPKAKYIFAIDRASMPTSEVQFLGEALNKIGVNDFVITMTHGNPRDSIAVFEVLK